MTLSLVARKVKQLNRTDLLELTNMGSMVLFVIIRYNRDRYNPDLQYKSTKWCIDNLSRNQLKCAK